MTTVSQSTKRKLSLLQLADEPGNVSRACQIMGYHRNAIYEVGRGGGSWRDGGSGWLSVPASRFA